MYINIINNDLLKIKIYRDYKILGTVESKIYTLLEFASVNIDPNKILSFNIIQVGGHIDFDYDASLFISNDSQKLYIHITKSQPNTNITYLIIYYE